MLWIKHALKSMLINNNMLFLGFANSEYLYMLTNMYK